MGEYGGPVEGSVAVVFQHCTMNRFQLSFAEVFNLEHIIMNCFDYAAEAAPTET